MEEFLTKAALTKFELTRLHISRKNDNACVEQKRWTHARGILGYLRYDTFVKLSIIDVAYHTDWQRAYKDGEL